MTEIQKKTQRTNHSEMTALDAAELEAASGAGIDWGRVGTLYVAGVTASLGNARSIGFLAGTAWGLIKK